MALQFQQYINLPPHQSGGFDHADVDEASGQVFVAHTALGQIDIVDGGRRNYTGAVLDCPEASGVLKAPGCNLVFAAARGAGQVLVLDPASAGQVLQKIGVGPRPNGLAWDGVRGRLLVADVGDHTARLFQIKAAGATLLATVALPGRPRWCLYDLRRDLFWVNIAEPALVVALAGESGAIVPAATWPIAYRGPHGLALDEAGDRLLVACDSSDLVKLDPANGTVAGQLPLAGPPDVVWYNPVGQRLYVAIGTPGVVQVVNVGDMTLKQEIVTEEGAHTLTFDPARQLLYVFLPKSHRAALYLEN